MVPVLYPSRFPTIRIGESLIPKSGDALLWPSDLYCIHQPQSQYLCYVLTRISPNVLWGAYLSSSVDAVPGKPPVAFETWAPNKIQLRGGFR